MDRVSFWYDNIRDMFEMLMQQGEISLEELCSQKLGITLRTYSRWKKDTHDGKFVKPVDATIKAAYELYIQKFDPPIQDKNSLVYERIEDIRIKDIVPDNFIDYFAGEFYLYYYSHHKGMESEVHWGKLKIYKERNSYNAVMINGLRGDHLADDVGFHKIFDRMEESYEHFLTLKNSIKDPVIKRINYYSGKVVLDQHSLVLNLSGKGSKSQHKQIIIFAIKRSEVGRKSDSPDSRQYKAGMGVMISLPNERHPSTRIFRIGISRIKLDYRSNSVHELLLQKVDEFHRVEVDSKADRGWVDIIQKTIHEQIKAAKWS